MPRLGFTPQTPPESTSPIVTFAHKDMDGITKKLGAARVDVRVAPYWIRIAPSVYNDMADIDRTAERLVVAARRRAFHNETRTLHVKWPIAPQPGNCVARQLARTR